MSSIVTLVGLAIVCGVAVVLQAQFMGVMDEGLGSIESVFITYGGGGLVVGLVMLALRGGGLSGWRSVPWYALTAGLLGLIIVGTIGYTTPRLGLALTFTIIVATQFVIGALIDHFGLLGAVVRPLTLSKVVGIATLLIGIWLIIRE